VPAGFAAIAHRTPPQATVLALPVIDKLSGFSNLPWFLAV